MIKKSPAKKTPTKKAPTKKKSAPKKKTVKSTPRKAKLEEPALTMLQTSKCQTLSGKSTLTCHVGADDKGHVYIRIHSNTGGGHFSNEWIPVERITTILSKLPSDQPITSLHLFPLFTRQSVNTPGFLLALLLNEKVLEPFQGKKRQYSYAGTDVFLAKINKLKARKKKS